MNEDLKKFRLALRLTQPEIAKSIGISLSMYEKVERGTMKPSRNFIEKVKNTYPHIDIYYIFFKTRQHFKC